MKNIFSRVAKEKFKATHFFVNAFKIALSFTTVIPVKKFPEWKSDNLRFFCLSLSLVGLIIGLFWFFLYYVLISLEKFSLNLRGVIMTLSTLALTGGIHMDGLIDSCDAIFSHRDLKKRLEILSDSHVGAFGVICCAGIMILKSALFSELIKDFQTGIFFVPLLSRSGAAILLNNLEFAKKDGLARSLGESRNKHDNIFLILIIIITGIFEPVIFSGFMISYFFWKNLCVKIFSGITGDLLGAFIEFSEVIILFCVVIKNCIL